MLRRPPRPTLFPYTPPFRSNHHTVAQSADLPRPDLLRLGVGRAAGDVLQAEPWHDRPVAEHRRRLLHRNGRRRDEQARSEENTSELQSRQYLVCRPLLEKKI